jgi:hypothetical protein
LVAGPLAKLVLGHLQQRVVQISATVKASRQGVKNMVRSARGVAAGRGRAFTCMAYGARMVRVHGACMVMCTMRACACPTQMRSWLGGKKGPETAPPAPSASSAAAASGGAPRYTANTIEAQLRQLADYAFMLRDSGTALANYRLAGGEFKGDKAWRHYAGALRP